MLLLPVDTSVGDVCGALAVTKACRHLGHAGLPGATTDVGVTCLSPTDTDLTAVQADGVGEILQELLIGEPPASSEGMERSPTVIRSEVRGTVITECISEEVAVVIIVSLTGEERRHGRTSET